jgi:hypothetical protein
VTPILDRIRANGGEVIRNEWRLTIRRGRLSDAALEWLRDPRRKSALLHETWHLADAFEERAAIREYMGGEDRETAEREAYRELYTA